MSWMVRFTAFLCTILFFCNIAIAQFLPEDQIPLEVQNQIITDVIAEHGYLDMTVLEAAFRDWLLSQPLPDADGQMLDAGTCSDCSPPLDGQNPIFPSVRNVEIISREGRVRPSFKVKWRKPIRLSREIRDLYELDRYEVFLVRDDGTYEHHVITKTLLADGAEKLKRRIRFRRRDPGIYTVHVRPVYVGAQQAEAPSSGLVQGSSMTGKASDSATRGGLSDGKGPWGDGGSSEVTPGSTVSEAFADGSNPELEACILDRLHFGIRTPPNGAIVQGYFDYTENTLLEEIDWLDCSYPDTDPTTPNQATIISIAQLDNFSILRGLNLTGNNVTDLGALSELVDFQELNLSDNDNVQTSGINALDALTRLYLDDINLGVNGLPGNLAVDSLLTYSLVNTNLKTIAFSCNDAPVIDVSFLDISSNGFSDQNLSLLAAYPANNLNASDNKFSSFSDPCSNNPTDLFAPISSLDLSGNGGNIGVGGGDPLSDDISSNVLSSLNLSDSDFSKLPAEMPEVCLELNISEMEYLSDWLLTDLATIPQGRPYTFNLNDSNELICEGSQKFRYWVSSRGTNTAAGCPILGLAYSEVFANDCDPEGDLDLRVERNSENQHHVLNWGGLLLEGQHRVFEYQLQKRFAGLHDPNSDEGIIGNNYEYGEVASAVISDTDNTLAYEFRIQQCVQNSASQECSQWSPWVEGDYPLIRPINTQVIWTDPVNGDYFLRWAYPQSYFDGHGQVNAFYLEYPLTNQTEFVTVGLHAPTWQSVAHTVASHGTVVRISACSAQNPASCGPAVVMNLSLPPELDANLTAPNIINSTVDPVSQNELTITLQNMTLGVDPDDATTIVDYYEVIEDGPTVDRTYYFDISRQSPGAQTTHKIKRYVGGDDYTFTFKACVRNRNGADICSVDSATLMDVDLAEPLGFNVITDTLCWVDRSGDGSNLNVQLEWQYSAAGGSTQPSYYRIETLSGGDQFVIDHASHTNASGVTVINQMVPFGNLVNEFWEVNGCPDASGSSCQSLGFVAAQPGQAECTNPTLDTVQTLEGGGPDDLRPGVWTSDQLPRQGWTFYWASDLRYDDVHIEYGDTYDLFAYWQTYQFNDVTSTWDAVWLYSELKQIVDGVPGDTICDNDGTGILGFQGALYYPDAGFSTTDMNVGDLIACFDPEDNNMVDIHLDISMDPGLESGEQQSFTLSEISNDTQVFPPPGSLGPNQQDYLNGSFGLNSTLDSIGKTRLISWSYSFLEGLIVLGFDDAGKPMWMNGTLDCRDSGVTCDSAGSIDGRPSLTSASFEFRTARLGLPPFVETPSEQGFENVAASINGILRTKHSDAADTGNEFEVGGFLSFGFSNDENVPIRSFSHNFAEPIARESSFHDIRYWVDDQQSATNCNIVDGVCEIRLSWFSDADFLGDGTPSIKAFYVHNNSNPDAMDGMPMDAAFCGAGDPADAFTVTDYVCQISSPGDYQFMLVNRMDAAGLPTNESNIIAISGTLNVLGEGTNANDDLGVADVGDVPLLVGVTTHDHDQITHVPSIGSVAGQAGVSGGAATYSIPINIPPGRQGMQPSVSLNYNSRAGNGTLGMGWSLSAGSSISRCPSTIAQDGFTKGVTYDDSDRLCLDGQRLMLVSGTYWAPGSQYRTEIDSFALVALNGSTSAATGGCTNTFTVRGKDNIERTYGDGDTHRVSPDPVSGGGCAVVNSWLLSKEKDPSGNDIRYVYTDMANGEHLLTTIKYTGDEFNEGTRRVVFGYGPRPADDQSTSYLGGYRTRQTQQLNTIQTFTDSSSNSKVREYRLGFGSSAGTSRLLLETVEECAYENGQQSACLPATLFEWGDGVAQFNWEKIQTVRDTATGLEPLLGSDDPLVLTTDQNGVEHPNVGRLEQLLDIDGDGSRELLFAEAGFPPTEYIASIDAEGNERWRANLALSCNANGEAVSGAGQFNLGQAPDTADLVSQYSYVVTDYVDALDVQDILSKEGEGPASQAQVDAYKQQLQTSLLQQLTEELESGGIGLERDRAYVDFDYDGITDFHGAVPDPNNSNAQVLAIGLRRPGVMGDGCFDQHFDTLLTDIPATSTSIVDTWLNDIDGDGDYDVIVQVDVTVTEAGTSESGEGLQLWENVGVKPDGSIDFAQHTGGLQIPPTQLNGEQGIIYLWPDDVQVTTPEGTFTVGEKPGGIAFNDINGDGLSDILINSVIDDFIFMYDDPNSSLVIQALIQTGFNEANVRVLLNQTQSIGAPAFDLLELSTETTIASDPYSRGQQSLGLLSDPRQTYYLPMDVNADGLRDYLLVPNRNQTDNNTLNLAWYVQINQGQAAGTEIFSAPMELTLPGNIQQSMRLMASQSANPINTPVFGNLIKPVDWDNDGQTELMVPRRVERPVCVTAKHTVTDVGPGGSGNSVFGIYCPNDQDNSDYSSHLMGVIEGGEDFNGVDVYNGNPHAVGLGHRDRSTYEMGIIEFDMSSTSGVSMRMIDDSNLGLSATAGSVADDGLGDGITDLLTIHGCEEIVDAPSNPPSNGAYLGTRCFDNPLGYTNPDYVNWFNAFGSLIDDAAVNRGYHITRNTAPRDQILDLMLSATDGFENRSDWSYAPLSSNPPERAMETDIPLYVMPNRSNGEDYLSQFDVGYFYFASSMYVVSQFDQSNGIDCDLGAGCLGIAKLQNSTYYGYEEAVYNGLGRGFQGFRKIVSEQVVTNPTGATDDSANNLRSISVFHQIFPLAGRLEATYTQLASVDYMPMQDRDVTNGGFMMPLNTLSNGLYEWSCRTGTGNINEAGQMVPLCDIANANGIDGAIAEVTESVAGVPGIFHPVMSYSYSEQKEIGSSTTAGEVYASSENSNRSYDGYGNMLGGTTISDNLSAGVSVLRHTQSITNTFVNDDTNSNWWLGRLAETMTTAQSDYPTNNPAAKTTRQLFEYNDPDVRQPDCQLVLNNDVVVSNCSATPTGVWTKTATEYDTNGNATEVSVSASDLPVTRITTMGYTDDGYFPDTITNSQGHIVMTTIDPREGNPSKVIDANQLITEMQYDPFGRVLETWYPINAGTGPATIAGHYAPRSSVRYTASCPGMPTDNMTYCMSSISDGAPIVQQGYDSLNRVLRTHSAGFAGATTVLEQTYNARGQMVADTVPRYTTGNTYTSEYLYDALGRMVYKVQPRQTMPNTPVQDIYSHYVHAGLTSTVLVGDNMTQPACDMSEGTLGVGTDLCVQRTYASNGWLLSTRDAHGYVTQFWYDGQGNPVLIHDPDGNATAASYNNLGHRLTLNDPNMGNWTYRYNGLGEVIDQTDANGVDFTFGYDDLGRLTNRTASCSGNSATMSDSWNYDVAANTNGLLGSSTCSDCDLAHTTKSYGYDSYNRPTIMAQVMSNNPNTSVSRMRVESRYDSYFARQASMTWYVDSTGSGFSDTPLVRQYNKYDINGYLVEQGDSRQYLGDTAANYNVASPAAWRHIDQMTPNGQIIEQQFGNDLVQTNQYFDATWQLHNIFIPDLQPDSPELMNYFYEYDLFGNITQQTSHSLTQAGGDATMDHEQFSYDRLHRLVNSNRTHYIGGSMTGNSAITYQYDPLGNIERKSDYAGNNLYTYGTANSDTCSNGLGGPNAVNAIDSHTYRYDCNGNLTQQSIDAGKNIDYNAYNKPIRIADGSNVTLNEFWYDADEQRYLQRKNGLTTTVYLDKVYERTGNVHKLYIDSFAVFTIDYETPLAEETGITYLHGDRLGSVAVMSQANGDPITNTSRGYDPFGKPRDGDWTNGDGDLNGYGETTRGFTGHEHMNESDLIHMNGRAYDYNLGRFLSVDPVIQFPSNSQSLNPYSYILNNPMAGTDPTGYTCNPVNGVEACSGGNTGQERSGSGPETETDSGHRDAPTNNQESPDRKMSEDQKRSPSDQRNEQEEEQEKPKELPRINSLPAPDIPRPLGVSGPFTFPQGGLAPWELGRGNSSGGTSAVDYLFGFRRLSPWVMALEFPMSTPQNVEGIRGPTMNEEVDDGEAGEGFEEEYDDLESATGSVNPLDDVEVVPTKNPKIKEQGFTEKHTGYDEANGEWRSAFKNPKTGKFSGGHSSSRNDFE